MNALKRPKRSVNRFLAAMLCVALMIEGTGMQVLAGTVPVSVVSVDETGTDNLTLSENGGFTGDGNEIISSGTYYGMEWTIDENGLLTISGAYDNTTVGSSWSSYADSVKSVKVTATGVANTSSWFKDFTNLQSTDFKEFDTSQVVRMDYMFYNCSNLKQLDVSNFVTENVTDMTGMFWGCKGLIALEVNNFDTSSVNDMDFMFCGCSELSALDLSGFNTLQVTNMHSMFAGCSGLVVLDLSSFATSNVTRMGGMFDGCSNLTSLNLSGFDTSSVTNMNGIFGGCEKLTDLNLGGNFNTINVEDMSYMFRGCSSLSGVDLSNFNIENVTNISGMFYDCTSLKSLDLSMFDTKNVSDMYSMFYNCSSLTSLYISNFNTEKVVSVESMFGNCSSLTSLDLSGFNLLSLERASYFFNGCTELNSLNTPRNISIDIMLPGTYEDLEGNLYTTLPKNKFESMFLEKSDKIAGVYNGIQWTIDDNGLLTLSGEYDAWDGGTSWGEYSDSVKAAKITATGVTSTSFWFQNMKALESVDFSEFDTSQLTDMSYMFHGCTSLKNLDLSELDLSNLNQASYFLYGCSGLEIIICPKNLSLMIELPTAYEDEDGNVYGTLPRKQTISKTLHVLESYIAAGGYKGMTWILDGDGYLLISGEYDETIGPTSWSRDNSENIKKVKVTATGVKNTSGWFEECYNLQSVDLSEFDSSQVTDMSFMFSSCENLIDLNLTGLDTSNVTDMSYMFSYCESITTLDVSSFNTENVTNMTGMFSSCKNLSVLDVSMFDTDSVESMEYMFYNCKGVTDLDVSGFITDKVVNMYSMFGNCSELTTLDVSKFNTSKVEYMSSMFENCSNLTSLDVSSFDVSNVIEIDEMFFSCSKLVNLDLSNFDMAKVEYADNMLSGCIMLDAIKTPLNVTISIPLKCKFADELGNEYSKLPRNMKESILIQKAEDVVAHGTYRGMSWIIDENGALTVEGVYQEEAEGDCWNNYAEAIVSAKVTATNVMSTSSWFRGAKNLKNVDLSELNTSNVYSMSAMFYGCSSLTTLDVSKFDTSQVESMSSMFRECSGLTNLDLSNFDTKNLYSMNYMFNCCSSLIDLDLSSFSTQNVESMNYIFKDCTSLKSVDLSSFDLRGLYDADEVFVGCKSLKEIKAPRYLSMDVVLPHVFKNGDGVEMTALPKDLEVSVALTSEVFGIGDNDKPESGTKDGDDKPELGTKDGDDKTETGTEDGDDKPAPGTEDGDDKPTSGTEDGDDKPESGPVDGDDDFYEEAIGEFKVSFVRDHVYTGKAITPKVIVTFGADKLVEGVDYTVSYKNNVNAGLVGSAKAPVIIVKGKGNYDSSETLEFNIHALEMTDKNTSVSEMISVQNNKQQTVKPVLTVAGKKLKAGKDYTIEYPDKGKIDGAYKNAGTYNILIKGCGNYQGNINTTMMILGEGQIMASKLKVAKIPAYDYVEGIPATPTPDVMNKKDKLEFGKDYAISYINNDRAGKATLVIIGLKNTDANGTFVAGTLKKTFTIKGTALKKAKAEYNNKVNYTGSAICPEIALTYDGKTLRPGIDYTVSYTNNVNVGKGTILLTGQGGYTGTVKKTFTIQADTTIVNKLAVNFVGGKAEASFDQKGAKPVVSVVLGDVTLKAGKDYTVSYKNNKKLAAANAEKAPIVIIKGKGNYKFTKEVPFAIVEKALTDTDMSIVSTDKFVGSKKGYLSAPVVKDGNGKKLKVNKDYKVLGYTVNGAAFDGTGEVAAGTVVTVTVEGMNNYKGRTQTTYRVANNDISKVKVNKPQLEYNGGKVTFTEEMLKEGNLELTDKATDKKLVYGTDFVVVGYKNNTKKGNATVTVQGIGEYGGTKAVKFSIVSKKIEKK